MTPKWVIFDPKITPFWPLFYGITHNVGRDSHVYIDTKYSGSRHVPEHVPKHVISCNFVFLAILRDLVGNRDFWVFWIFGVRTENICLAGIDVLDPYFGYRPQICQKTQKWHFLPSCQVITWGFCTFRDIPKHQKWPLFGHTFWPTFNGVCPNFGQKRGPKMTQKWPFFEHFWTPNLTLIYVPKYVTCMYIFTLWL